MDSDPSFTIAASFIQRVLDGVNQGVVIPSSQKGEEVRSEKSCLLFPIAHHKFGSISVTENRCYQIHCLLYK